MGLTDSIKGSFIKAAVSHLTDGDRGSTLLGTVGAGLLAANIDWSQVSRGFTDEKSAIECGKAAGIALILVWGYFTGKKAAAAKAAAAGNEK